MPEMNTLTWVLVGAGTVLIVLDVVLRPRGAKRDRETEVRHRVIRTASVVGVVAVILLVSAIVR